MTPESPEWQNTLRKILDRWEVMLPPEGFDYFQVYLDELSQWNKKISLTALREPVAIALGHFADSLAVMTLEEIFNLNHARVIDIGAGAGFPGLPLKIANPGWHLSLVDSVGKKCDFLKSVIASLELNHVGVYYMRSEELGNNPDHREKYDLALARALTNLSTLIEYAVPFLKVGGRLVAHRGRTAADEASRIQPTLNELGCEVVGIQHYDIQGLGGSRSLVQIRKIYPTSRHYPRRVGVAAKRPL